MRDDLSKTLKEANVYLSVSGTEKATQKANCIEALNKI